MGGFAGTIPANFIQASMIIDYVRVYQNIAPDIQPPTNFTATLGTISGSSVELKLNAQDNSGMIKYAINYGNNSDTVIGLSGIQKSALISNLLPQTAFTFTVSARDMAGNTASNNPIVLNATTLLTQECEGTGTAASIGSFTDGYKYKFETFGTDVKITFELLDNRPGLVAYLWRQAPFSEVQMTNVSGRIFTHTITGQTIGATINYAVKFAYAGGMSVTAYIPYVVGNNCVTGVKETENARISCFPSPTDGRVFFTGLENSTYTYSLMDLTSKTILTGYHHPESPFLDLSECNSGIYILKMSTEDRFTFRKVMLRK